MTGDSVPGGPVQRLPRRAPLGMTSLDSHNPQAAPPAVGHRVLLQLWRWPSGLPAGRTEEAASLPAGASLPRQSSGGLCRPRTVPPTER